MIRIRLLRADQAKKSRLIELCHEIGDTAYMLRPFGEKIPAVRKAYMAYVERGIAHGRRPELVGGGLIRSAGGWSAVQAMRRVPDHMKSDERILGDGVFAQFVFKAARERLEERYQLKAQGYDLDKGTKLFIEFSPENTGQCGRVAVTWSDENSPESVHLSRGIKIG